MKITKQIAPNYITKLTTYSTPQLSIFIENYNGLHTHKRNKESFKGEQKDCPLCANGSDFERAMGTVGA